MTRETARGLIEWQCLSIQMVVIMAVGQWEGATLPVLGIVIGVQEFGVGGEGCVLVQILN